MQGTVYIDRSEVEPIIATPFPGYRGTKIRVKPAESVTLRDLNWSGGTRNQYAGCSLAEGRATGDAGAGNAAPPWANPYEGASIALQPGLALVEWSQFCGKDLGLTIHVHPSMMPRFLPSAGEGLGRDEEVVLFVTRSLISSYRRGEAERLGVNSAGYAQAQEFLKTRGLLTKIGALTTAGKNAASTLRF